MSEKKEDECPSEEASSQAESFDTNKSGTSDTYDMKDFCPGIRIEAKDFDGKWYPAKVSDVDWTENEILVHFENWNTKFDEWIPMDSSRLRPIQKPAQQQKEVVKFSKGEEVMAVWSANQKYPGVIQAVLANDRYDVLFCDGFLKRLKGHKISKIQGGIVKPEVKTFPDIGTKEERRERKRKINVAELFHINKRSRKKGLVHSKPEDIKTYPVSKPKSKGSVIKKPSLEENKEGGEHPEENEAKPVDKPVVPAPPQANKSLVENIPAAFEVKYLNGQTEMWSKQLYQRSEGRTAGKLDIVILNPQGRKFRSRNEIMKYCEENGIVYSHEAFDFSAKGRPKSKSFMQTQMQKSESVEDKEKSALKKGSRKSQSDIFIGPQIVAGLPPQTDAFTPENAAPSKVFIGDYEVVIENGKFICPVKICGKHFRRENLLHMHMKHYHPEFSKYLDYTPSVTDLAYARTVGSLDSNDVPSPAPRKVASAEKTEKSVTKPENVRKASEISPETSKEAKKLRLDGKVEGRSHSIKTSIDVPAAAASSEEPSEENQKNKNTSSGVQLPRTTSNETESSGQENAGNSLAVTPAEPVTLEGETLTPKSNVLKSVRHQRLHSRKKSGRFQGSFSEHLRKKRFISQDRSRSHNRIGRQQQSQLRQQLQQAQPPQTTVSPHPCVEDTNANNLSQGHAMARYPKPHMNLSNEISGKNNLVTNCKSVSPVSHKSDRSESNSENIENLKAEVNKSREFSENGKRRERQPDYSRRSFLKGLLSAQKRKGNTIRKRIRKKRRERTWKSSGAGITSIKSKSGRKEYKEKPDEHENDFSSAESNTNKSPVPSSVNDSQSDALQSPAMEEKHVLSQTKIPILKIKRLNSSDIELNTSVDGRFSVIEPKTEPCLESSESNRNVAPENEALWNISEQENVKNSPRGVEGLKSDVNVRDLPKSYVLLENVCRKETHSKVTNNVPKRNGENCRSRSEQQSRQRRGQKRKENKNVYRRHMPAKKVRFESTETWITVDEGDPYNPNRREEKKKKQRKIQLVDDKNDKGEKHSDDDSRESIPNNKASGLDQAEGTEDSKSPVTLENDKVEKLRRNEIINCLCGITEEDGLMIQCDLCLCWQHGHCAGILRELDVPDKYICAICKNPYRGRSSMKYLHDQEWLKEGTLPSLPFRSKRDDIIDQRKTLLKRSHDLSGSITLLAQVIHSLRIKVNIAEKKDHPKLWLWAKKWTEKKPNRLKESEIKEERQEEQNVDSNVEVKTEGISQDEKHLPKAPEPEAPIDSAECRINLLDHLIHYQNLIDARLSCIESLVAELESMQDDAVNDETPDRYPRTKATVQMILRDLNTMKKIATI